MAVEEYMGDGTRDDKELLNLIEFLEEIKNENDVRDVLTEKFGIRAALEESKMLWFFCFKIIKENKII